MQPQSTKRKRGQPAREQQFGEQRSETKRRKLVPTSFPTAAFWDSLITVPLTKLALRELDRRNEDCSNPEKPSQLFPTKKAHSRRRKVAKPTGIEKYCRALHNRQREQLQRFARLGGPDLTDIRGYQIGNRCLNVRMPPNNAKSKGKSRSSHDRPNDVPTTATTTTKSTSPYDRAFDQHLTQFGIYPLYYENEDGEGLPEPVNLQEIVDRSLEPRRSLSPSMFSAEHFQEFRKQNDAARKEKQVSELVIPFIEGRITKPNCRSGGVPFTNLEPLTNGTITPGNPDIYYGCRLERLQEEVQEELQHLIVPSTQHDLPAIPNFLLAVKGPRGTAEVAKRQARYDGAIGARAMHAIISYAQQEEIDSGKAYAITSIFIAGTLSMYTSHQVQTEHGRVYAMPQINSWAMDGNRTTFVQGATAYRNLRDWAEEQRNSAIKRANEFVSAASQAHAEDTEIFGSQVPRLSQQALADISESESENNRLSSTEPRHKKHRRTPPYTEPAKRKRLATKPNDSRESSVDPLAL